MKKKHNGTNLHLFNLLTGHFNDEKLKEIDKLLENKDEENLRQLVEMLNDNSWALRERIVKILIKQEEVIIPFLLEALLEGVWYVRSAIALVLTEIGGIESIEILLPYVNDSNIQVRENVNKALCEICIRCDKESLEILLKNLSPEKQVLLNFILEKLPLIKEMKNNKQNIENKKQKEKKHKKEKIMEKEITPLNTEVKEVIETIPKETSEEIESSPERGILLEEYRKIVRNLIEEESKET